ncbi:MAG: helix-turn-helix transcriptional regulator [Leptospiraceae bacterium]|nr:helix-turn-helix transcriptional regulator [Leptospiraceae bacterium]
MKFQGPVFSLILSILPAGTRCRLPAGRRPTSSRPNKGSRRLQITLLLLTIAGFIGACQKPTPATLVLDQWQLKIHNSWHKSGPVCWEASPMEGGPGIQYDGYASYQATFRLSPLLAGQQLAFFTECIDDADRTWLNGQLIGATGQFPVEGSLDQGFRSAVRVPRLYFLPPGLLHLEEPNTIRIDVYDYSGNGGFCRLQQPMIGPYQSLQQIDSMQRMVNNVPRIAALTLILIAAFYFFVPLLQTVRSRQDWWQLLRYTLLVFAGRLQKSSMQSLPGGTLSGPELTVELNLRRLASTFAAVAAFLFLLSELPFKYVFLESERFWFKAPALALYVFLFWTGLIFHKEVFGSRFLVPRNGFWSLVRFVFYILCHPFWTLVAFCYALWQPPRVVWVSFTTLVIFYFMFVQVILFLLTSVDLFWASFSKLLRSSRRTLVTESLLRSLWFLANISGIVIFKWTSQFNNHAFLVTHLFMLGSLVLSVRFLAKSEISLPIQKRDQLTLTELLHLQWHLTKTEIRLCGQILAGHSRDSIKETLNLTDNSLKFHLKNIYAKTIDIDKFEAPSRHGKFQRLTAFLYKLRDTCGDE